MSKLDIPQRDAVNNFHDILADLQARYGGHTSGFQTAHYEKIAATLTVGACMNDATQSTKDKLSNIYTILDEIAGALARLNHTIKGDD